MLITALGALGALVALTDPHESVKSFISESGVDIKPEYYVTDENGGWCVYADKAKIRLPLIAAALLSNCLALRLTTRL